MFVIAFLNQKGGSGKTTASVQVASVLHRRGKRVVVVDMDPQQSATKWADRGAAKGRDVPPVQPSSADAVWARRDVLAKTYDVMVIDGAPGVGDELRAAIEIAEVVAIPVYPGGPDMWATHEASMIVERACLADPRLRAFAFINRGERGTITTESERALHKLRGVAPLGVTIRKRAAIAKAMVAGASVEDVEPKGDAAIEFRRLTKALLRSEVAA